MLSEHGNFCNRTVALVTADFRSAAVVDLPTPDRSARSHAAIPVTHAEAEAIRQRSDEPTTGTAKLTGLTWQSQDEM
jgi:hypothetical protein